MNRPPFCCLLKRSTLSVLRRPSLTPHGQTVIPTYLTPDLIINATQQDERLFYCSFLWFYVSKFERKTPAAPIRLLTSFESKTKI